MRAAIPLFLLLLFGCGDAREARVEFDLRTEPCVHGQCTVHLRGEGLIYTAGSENEQGYAGEDTLYAEIYTSSGALALVEIGIAGTEVRVVRYREIVQGAVAFAGRIENEHVAVVDDGIWKFSFEAHDPEAPSGSKPARTLSNGRVRLVELGPDPETPPTTVSQPPTVPENPPPPPPPSPPPRPDDRRPPPPPPPPPVYVDTSGCDASCEGGSGDGCEGDTSSSSGCEGDSGGCEGDTASSAGDCDSCEGDVALTDGSDVLKKRAMLGALRLSWPIWLVGWFNRRWRRSARTRPPPPCR